MQEQSGGFVSFGEANFGKAELGDRRRTERLIALADQMQRHPGGSLPAKAEDPAMLKALYGLMSAKTVTHATVLAPHQQRTAERIEALSDETILIIHDTTELNYTSRRSLHDDLGQIGDGYGRGYECHNSLAVVAGTREALGLTSQILHVRPLEGTKGRTIAQLRKDPNRESRLWVRGAAATPPRRHCVDVCDRGADTFEFLDYEIVNHRRFVVRSTHSRALAEQAPGGPRYLHGLARSLPEMGRRRLTLTGNAKRKARKTEVAIAATEVTLAVPTQERGEYRGIPLSLQVIRVWEVQPPPKGEKPLEWILLTSEECPDFSATCQVVDWYAARPVVEELHKAMKTGCAIEEFQFTSVDRLQPAIALTSVVAITLLNLRDASRRPDAKERLATEFLSADYVEVLSYRRYKRVRMDLSLHDFFYALARLGGHQNRRGDKMPGWLVLWRGWTALQHMVAGAEVAREIKRGSCEKRGGTTKKKSGFAEV